MAKLFSLFLGIILSFSAFSQERAVYGRVVDSTRHEGINNLIIQNLTSGQMVNTNAAGDFYIRAVAGDSLVVMDLGYDRVGVVFDGKNKYPVIATTQKPIMLKEVVITEKRWLELQDEINDFLENPSNGGAIREQILGNMLNTNTSQPGIGISIDGLYDLWSKQGKLNRKVADLKYNDIKEFYANLKYNPKFVMKVTKLEEDEVADFMRYCKINDEFVLRASEYDLTSKVLQCLKEYRLSRVYRKVR